MPNKRLEAVIRGRVQAVGFRAFVETRALRLGVEGYVRNTQAGDVEVVAEGPEQRLQALLDDLGRGPGAARVESVDHQWREATGQFHAFRIAW
jgi:acylphosphatase